MNANHGILIGSILLERNRWKNPKTPTYRVSEWIERFTEAGFDGVELWEYHATLASPEEQKALEASSLPITIFNSYASFDENGAQARASAAEFAARLKSQGIKYNLGPDPNAMDTYRKALVAWEKTVPEGVRLLCECHPNTVLEKPEQAAAFLAPFDPSRYQVIVHGFYNPIAPLAEWFRLLGPRITHVHVQMIDPDHPKGRRICLDRRPQDAKDALKVMRDHGFSGTFTLEFTEGTSAPDENMEDLFQAALRDFAFLKEHWGN